jgi:hypothetical protein|tara:strand:- start:48 stop:248 length:201 start_codon:yes stop_codon:yes gene_type:complete
MSTFRGYEIEIDFISKDNLNRNEWGVLLIKGERSHFMTFNVARTLSSVEHDVYAKIDQLIEEEKKQ